MVKEGAPAPDFELPADDGSTVKLSDLRGKKVVLYFYPKDDTPGCTKQACGIRDDWSAFQDTGAVILGVSTDDVKSHVKFKEKYDLPFTLLADTEQEVVKKYDVWKPKKMFGKEFMGTQRSTFVIDEEGNVAKIFRRVKPVEHAEQVLAVL